MISYIHINDFWVVTFLRKRISRVGTPDSVAKINKALQREIEAGKVKSIRPMHLKNGGFIIGVSPFASRESIFTICQKINNAGYRTTVLSANGLERCPPSLIQRYQRRKNLLTRSKKIIIAEKVTLPNLPSTPIEFPSLNDLSPQNNKERKKQR